MTIIPTGYAQINWLFTGTSVPLGAEVTLGVDISSYGGTPAAAAAVARDHWAANVSPRQTSTTLLSGVKVKFGPSLTGPSAEVSASTAGGAGGAGVTPAVSVLVHKRTLAGGRAGRGRMFVPGLQETDLDTSGVIGGATLTAWQTSISAFLTAMGTSLLIPVVLHGVGSPITVPSTITALDVDALAATQRRRQRH